MNDNGKCKLAGIIYAVDGPFAFIANPNPNSPDPHERPFYAALFDARGLYSQEGNSWVLVGDIVPVPTGFYPTRIATKLAWICSIVAAPTVSRADNYLALTYTKLAIAGAGYIVEQSTDLVNWTPATTTETTLSSAGDSSVVQAKVDVTNASVLFLRLRTTATLTLTSGRGVCRNRAAR